MKLLIVPALLISSTLFAQQTKPTKPTKSRVIIRPLLQEKLNIDNAVEMSIFLNGLTATCPDGMVIVDTSHMLKTNMTYTETFNSMATLECQYPKNSK